MPFFIHRQCLLVPLYCSGLLRQLVRSRHGTLSPFLRSRRLIVSVRLCLLID